MNTTFPYVKIPEDLKNVFGPRQDGTRIYRKEGAEEEAGAWFDAVHELLGSTVSPGGVAMYCPVSRAAVHKRIKEGRLTAFLFHTTHQKTNLFGKKRTLRASPHCYIPVSECKAWKEELEKEALRRGYISPEELEGAKPDWAGDFFEWQVKNERLPRSGILEGMSFLEKLKFLTEVITKNEGKSTIPEQIKENQEDEK